MKKLISKGLLLTMTLLTLVGCGNKAGESKETHSATDGSANKEKLIIGVDDQFAPMGFRDDSNELVGFDVDVAKAVGERLGYEVEFQVIDWQMKEQELTQGNIDLIWNGYTITEKRQEQVNFSKPYLANKQVVLVKADSEIKTMADLAGKNVTAQVASGAVDAMEKNPEILESFELFTQDTNVMCIMELDADRVDAVVADSVLLEYIIARKEDPSQYRFLEEDFGEEKFGVGIRKEDTELLEKINKTLDEMKADGSLAEISTEWFGSDIILK